MDQDSQSTRSPGIDEDAEEDVLDEESALPTSPRGKKRKIALSESAAEQLLETVEETEAIQKQMLSKWLLPSQQAQLMQVLQESRRELEEKMRAQIEESGGFDEQDDEDIVSDEDKHAAVAQTRSILNNLQSSIDKVFADDDMHQLAGMSRWRQLLSICDVFRTPYEKLQISDLLVSIFNAVVETEVVPRFLYFATLNDRPSLQWEALDTLTYIAPGLRIPGIPEDSEWHPANMLSQKQLVDNGAVEILIDLLDSSNQDLIKAHAVKVLVCLCQHCGAARDYVLSKHIMDPLFALTDIENIELARNIANLLALLCVSPDLRDHGSQIIDELSHYLDVDDDKLVIHMINLLVIYRDQISQDLCNRLLDLSTHSSDKVRLAALSAIADTFSSGNVAILDDGGLQAIIERLPNEHHEPTLIHLLHIVGAVARAEGEYVDALFQLDLLPVLLPLMEDASADVTQVALEITRNMTRYASDGALLDAFANQDFVSMQCIELENWQTLDHKLKPTYHLNMVRDALEVLYNVLSAGEREIKERGKTIVVNEHSALFDMECVDRLLMLHMAFSYVHDPSVRIYAPEFANKCKELLRMVEAGLDPKSYEAQRIHTLLKVHFDNLDDDTDDSDSVSSSGMDLQRVNRNIMDTQTTAGSDFDHSQYRHDTKVPVKTYFKANGTSDHRFFYVPRSLSYKEFRAHLESEYGERLTLFYRDREELCTIRSNASLEAAFVHSEMEARRQANDHSRDGSGFRSRNRRDRRRRQDAYQQPVLKVLCRIDDGSASANSTMDSDSRRSRRRRAPKKDRLKASLGKQTRFSQDELDELLEFWSKRAHHGQLDAEEFAIGMRQLGIDDERNIEQAFTAFDTDGNGSIDLREVVVGLGALEHGSFDDRLMLAFRAYDKDRSGYISKEEVKEVFVASMRNQGVDPEEDEDLIDAQVDECFERVDANGDGQLDYEEFKRAVKQSLITNAFGF